MAVIIQIRGHDKTKELPNFIGKLIEYFDNVYLHKLITMDLINIPVNGFERKYGLKIKKDHGRHPR